MSRIVLISNGHGEDLMAALLADRMRSRAEQRGDVTLSVTGFPMVGDGGAYTRRGVPIAGVQGTMPSGGFIWKGATNLISDLKAGLLGLTLRQIRALKACRSRFDYAVALGDIYCLWLAGRVLKRPTVFVPTAKSEYISGHYGFEYRMMRHMATKIFPRDEATARAMRDRGLSAAFLGNLMMDALDVDGIDFFSGARASGVEPSVGGAVITLLPGSREEAYENAVDLAQVVAALPADFRFLLSLAPGLDAGRLEQRLAGERADQRWRYTPRPGAQGTGAVGTLARDGRTIVVVQGCFGDVLASADLVIGLAGTGNEQAVGLGKPLITFPGRGKQFTRRFAEDQRKLLGESLSLVARDPAVVAREAQAILSDRVRYERMSQEGKRRMGLPGGLDRMAEAIERWVGGPSMSL